MFNLFKKKSFKNWFILAASTGLSSVISFLVFIFIGRKMSVDGYATFNVVTALGTTFATIVNNVACGTVLNRHIATHPYKCASFVKKSFVIRLSSFLIGAIAISLFSVFKYSYGFVLTVFVAVFLSYDVFYEFFEQFAFGFKTTKFSSLINIASMAILLLVFLIIPSRLCSVENVLLIYSVIYLCKCIAYFFMDLPLLKKSEPGDDTSFLQIIKESLPYFWLRVVGILSTQLPVLLLEGFSELSQVSFYSVGNKFTLPMTILVNTSISAFFPYFSQFYKSDRKKYVKYLYLMLSLAIQVSSVFAVLLSSTSDFWLTLIMGAKYSDAIYPFKIQVWYTCILCIDLVVSMAFSSSFKQTSLAVITTIDVAILLPMLFLTVKFGAVGVAICKLVCAAVCLSYHIIIFVKLVPPDKKRMIGIFIQIAIMLQLLLIVTVSNNWLTSIVSATIALIVDLSIDISYFKELKEDAQNG